MGFPHSDCRVEYNGKTEWYGFNKPKFPETPVDKNFVDHCDRNRYMKHLVKFKIDDSIFEQIIKNLLRKHEGLIYYVGQSSDGVNLSVSAGKWFGLKTWHSPNTIRDNLVSNLD
jgi:hypothetical protein